jgi:hypothetical protein
MASQARRSAALIVSACLILSESSAAGAELQEQTVRAYESYRDGVRTRFLARSHSPGDRPPDGIAGRPAGEDGIISIAGGLIHHWQGVGFMRGVNLATAIEVSRNYGAYPSIYKEIIASRVLEHEGDRYRILLRLKDGDAGITAVLDVRSTVRYLFPDNRHLFTTSTSEEIREVRSAGTAGETLLPPGRDSGYLWRADVFTSVAETADGVYVEMETLGLSRAFPPMLGWIIEPVARRFGRKSVVRSLEQFQAAAIAAARQGA